MINCRIYGYLRALGGRAPDASALVQVWRKHSTKKSAEMRPASRFY
jgi:hypothetical protein